MTTRPKTQVEDQNKNKLINLIPWVELNNINTDKINK